MRTSFFAGIVACLIGIGGGMVLGPMILVMGIHPRIRQLRLLQKLD